MLILVENFGVLFFLAFFLLIYIYGMIVFGLQNDAFGICSDVTVFCLQRSPRRKLAMEEEKEETV